MVNSGIAFIFAPHAPIEMGGRMILMIGDK